MLYLFDVEMNAERSFYHTMETVDCADEESSPVDIPSPSESLPCPSPLRVAPSDGANTLINRETNSSVRMITTLLHS